MATGTLPPSWWRAGSEWAWQSILLRPVGWLWALVGRVRLALVKPQQVSAPVVCVGNIVLGGAGKTPVVSALLAHLLSQGKAPHVLTRGYGGSLSQKASGAIRVNPVSHTAAEVGDEPLLLSRIAPVWVHPDRRRSAMAAIADGADILIMDDGFQNPGLAKDISIVVFDGATGVGNGLVFPAGPLRETVDHGLARASAAMIIGDDATGVAKRLSTLAPDIAVGFCEVVADKKSTEALSGRPVVAFAGIGRPSKFFDTLEGMGADIVQRLSYPDHHVYRPTDFARLSELARINGAVLATTEKDAVKLPSEFLEQIVVVSITLDVSSGADFGALLALLNDTH